MSSENADANQYSDDQITLADFSDPDEKSRIELLNDGICPTCRKAYSSRHGACLHHSSSHGSPAITDDMLLEELHRLRDALGRVPTFYDMGDHGEYSVYPYKDRFDSWTNALEEAGYPPTHEMNIPAEDLLEELRRLHEELGRVPMREDMDAHGEYGAGPYYRQFESWNNALREAGYQLNRERNIPAEDLLEELHRLHDELGHVPTAQDMYVFGEYSRQVYSRRFGGWSDALKEAGYEPPTHSDYIPSGEDHPCWNGGHAGYYGPNWGRQRKKALERDDFQCVGCGRSREGQYELWGSDLEMHHKRPLTTFPFVDDEYNRDWEEANALSNLMTCCNACHPAFDNASRAQYPSDEYPRYIEPKDDAKE